MSKKIVNDPKDAVDESLAGLVASNPHLVLLEGHRVVVRSDVEEFKASGKVAVLCGGGSGHEPSHGGFVGKGMLTAAVAGSVFASPPTVSILAAIKAICGKAGCLVLLKNYTGDRLNFGLAVEQARAEGLKVEMVVVSEDCALPSHSKTAGRRGLCGALLVEKMAGALAEEGKSLEEITREAREISLSIGTLGVSLSPCSIPGSAPSFQLPNDELEFGLGIHGEAGVKRAKMLPSKSIAKWLLDHITSKESGYGYFSLEKGDKIGLVVNNLGGTSNLEMGILANDTIRYLTDECGVDVMRVICGAMMTSLEMAGVSLTLIKLDNPKWVWLLDQPTTAVAWPNVTTNIDRCDRPHLPASPSEDTTLTTPVSTTTAQGIFLRKCLKGICKLFVEKESMLNDLDRSSGDGDCGTTLKNGASSLLAQVDLIQWDIPKKALMEMASITSKEMGGTSGALYSLFLVSASQHVQDSSPVSWLKAAQAGLAAVLKYGGACPGDRTLVDSLQPSLLAVEKGLNEGRDIYSVVTAAFKAARDGAEATRNMDAKSGRASYVDKKHLTQPDPGAMAVTFIFEAVSNSLQMTSTD
jgi:dihydroxyacetone kinase